MKSILQKYKIKRNWEQVKTLVKEDLSLKKSILNQVNKPQLCQVFWCFWKYTTTKVANYSLDYCQKLNDQ